MTSAEYDRPTWDGRVREDVAEILVRQSRGESEYQAVTLKVNRRFTGRYQMGAHYTWGKERDTDSNERSATGVTISDTGNLDYDWGLSDRDVKHRLVVTGMIQFRPTPRVSAPNTSRVRTRSSTWSRLRLPASPLTGTARTTGRSLKRRLVGRNTERTSRFRRSTCECAKLLRSATVAARRLASVTVRPEQLRRRLRAAEHPERKRPRHPRDPVVPDHEPAPVADRRPVQLLADRSERSRGA